VTGFSPSTSVFPCQYHSTNASYPFIHLPPTLYNVSLPALQFSPVSAITTLLRTQLSERQVCEACKSPNAMLYRKVKWNPE